MKNFIYPIFVYLNLLAIGCLFLLVFLFLFKKTKQMIFSVIQRFGYWLIFLISFLATIGSLSFSEILGWLPCKLCWYQRILMYPQVLISFIAIWLKDKKIYLYHIWLSFFGFFIALFHYLIQREVIKGVDCNLVISNGSCLSKINFSFGFVSIPFMAMTAFLMIIVISFLAKNNNFS